MRGSLSVLRQREQLPRRGLRHVNKVTLHRSRLVSLQVRGTMTLVRTWSSVAVIFMAHSYLYATTTCAQSLALAHELTLSLRPAASACSADDACGSKLVPPRTSRAASRAEELTQDEHRAALDAKSLNVWKSVPLNDLLAYDRSNTEPAIGLRSVPPAELHMAQNPATPYPAYDLRVRLKEQVRKELGGFSPTGLNTLVHGRKTLGVDYRIRFR